MGGDFVTDSLQHALQKVEQLDFIIDQDDAAGRGWRWGNAGWRFGRRLISHPFAPFPFCLQGMRLENLVLGNYCMQSFAPKRVNLLRFPADARRTNRQTHRGPAGCSASHGPGLSERSTQLWRLLPEPAARISPPAEGEPACRRRHERS